MNESITYTLRIGLYVICVNRINVCLSACPALCLSTCLLCKRLQPSTYELFVWTSALYAFQRFSLMEVEERKTGEATGVK